MARYSEEIIEQVRQNNDVVDVISQYVHRGCYFRVCEASEERGQLFWPLSFP